MAMEPQPELLASVEGPVGHLRLNRPKAINALNQNICQLMTDALLKWREDSSVKLIFVEHEGDRGFCAGGDLKAMASTPSIGRAFFRTEYRLNHLLFTSPTPIVAFMDGVTMGGGMGISAPAQFRVATERTSFAMPETVIGMIPDVGSSWYLPRRPSCFGTWLALTSDRVSGADALAFGVATHFVPSADLADLKQALSDNPSSADTTLARFARHPGAGPLAPHQDEMQRCFSLDTVEEIVAALEREGSGWTKAQLEALKLRSPQALKLTLATLRRGPALTSFEESLKLEYRVNSRLIATPDFIEGVRALLIDKDQAPKWKPSTLSEVSDQHVESFFAPLPPDEELSL